MIISQGLVKTFRVIFQFFVRIIVPVFGQKMVVKNIYYNAGIMMIIGVESFGALTKYGMRIGKCVDGAVQDDSFLDFQRKSVKFFSVNAVCHKIANFQQIVVSRKVYVG